jgi:hypothetical protein
MSSVPSENRSHVSTFPRRAARTLGGTRWRYLVAATQYLHRVPPKVRGALLGNVDAWLLFSLGVEDMEDAWKIVNGKAHGWTPQDLVEGLHAHEVAMAVGGDLVKLRTVPCPPQSASAANVRNLVTESSQRYAQPEDSEASPWILSQVDTEGVLRSTHGNPRLIHPGDSHPPLSRPQLEAALTRASAAGDVVRGSSDDPPRLTERGAIHLRALEARRNDGEEHVETLTEFAMFLRARGIALAIPQQIAGVLTPDGQFRWGGSTYNVEVECSTVATGAGQVVRNVKKALAADFRVLVVLPSHSRVARALELLQEGVLGLRLWADGVGLVFRDGDEFRPHREPDSIVWPFLERGPPSEALAESLSELDTPQKVADTDPLVIALRSAIHDLLASGRATATARELLAELPLADQAGRTDEQVGIALGALGLSHRRIRAGGVRLRVYDLTSIGAPDAGGSERSSDGPAARTDAGPRRELAQLDRERRSTDSPIEKDRPGPADPGGPTD